MSGKQKIWKGKTMTYSYVIRILAFTFAIIFTIISHSSAQSDDYTVVERGLDYKVLQKTTIEYGTNCIHRYIELAGGLNYNDAGGQWVESKEQIKVLPQGGAVAVQGQHKVYFPADIYNGVI